MAIRPLLVDEHSPFLEESCALCKEPFVLGEWIVVCPDDATRHHIPCWEANNNHCTAYGCTGAGELLLPGDEGWEEEEEEVSDEAEPEILEPEVVESVAFRRRWGDRSGRAGTATEDEPRTKVRTLPASTFGCAQGCLVLAIALAIVLMSVSCFGLWAILDYLMLEVWGFDYREPLSAFFRPGGILFALYLSISTFPILR